MLIYLKKIRIKGEKVVTKITENKYKRKLLKNPYFFVLKIYSLHRWVLIKKMPARRRISYIVRH